MRNILSIPTALLLLIIPAYAGSYVIVCSSSCIASDGTTQPPGTILNRIVADPSFDPGTGLTLQSDTGQVVYAPAAPALTVTQQGATAIASGITITWSASTPLNGTYAMDVPTQSNVQAELLAILVNGTFTNGTAAIAWPDVSGTLHTFSVAQFKILATVLGTYVGAVDAFILGIGALPATTAAVTG